MIYTKNKIIILLFVIQVSTALAQQNKSNSTFNKEEQKYSKLLNEYNKSQTDLYNEERTLVESKAKIENYINNQKKQNYYFITRHYFQAGKPFSEEITKCLELSDTETAIVNEAFLKEADLFKKYLIDLFPEYKDDSIVSILNKVSQEFYKGITSEISEKVRLALEDGLKDSILCYEDIYGSQSLFVKAFGYLEALRLKTYQEVYPHLRNQQHKNLRYFFGTHFYRWGISDNGNGFWAVVTREHGSAHLTYNIELQNDEKETIQAEINKNIDSLNNMIKEHELSAMSVYYQSDQPLHDKIATYLNLTKDQHIKVNDVFQREYNCFKERLLKMIQENIPEILSNINGSLVIGEIVKLAFIERRKNKHPDDEILISLLNDPQVSSGEKIIYMDIEAPKATYTLIWGPLKKCRSLSHQEFKSFLTPEQAETLSIIMGDFFIDKAIDNANIALTNIRMKK